MYKIQLISNNRSTEVHMDTDMMLNIIHDGEDMRLYLTKDLELRVMSLRYIPVEVNINVSGSTTVFLEDDLIYTPKSSKIHKRYIKYPRRKLSF